MKLDISSEATRFKDHLDIEDNDHIMFSGIFGIGKTYFLKEFFEQHTEEYEQFLLSPINYSISSNDDIINYIKYDLAFELLKKGIDFEKTDYSKLFTAQFFIQENFTDTTVSLAQYTGKIGKLFTEIYKPIKKLHDDIKEHNKESQTDQQKELVNFLKALTLKDNSIYEENQITQLINGLIEKLKENKKKTVLVIDDLDRLDPEHIFRILNVFACHFDLDNASGNKFGINKIILVCDIENIRNLFHAKYGANVDFSGYIDKFYSSEVFYFDNKKNIIDHVEKLVSSIKIEHKTIPDFNEIMNFLDYNMFSTKTITIILTDLVLHNLINLRSLLKNYDKKITLHDKVYTLNGVRKIRNSQYNSILIFEILIAIYGTKNGLQIALNKLAEVSDDKTLTDKYSFDPYKDFLVLHAYKQNQRGKFTYTNSEKNLAIQYTVIQTGSNRDLFSASIEEYSYLNETNGKIKFPFAKILKEAYDVYLSLT